MSESPSNRDDISTDTPRAHRPVQATADHKPLEGRVSTLEVHMDHMASTVTTMGKTMQTGFAETRHMFEEGEARANTRDNKLHARITDHQAAVLQKGQWSWPTIVITVGLLFTVGGLFTKFVDLRLTADEVLIKQTQENVRELKNKNNTIDEQTRTERTRLLINQARIDERLRKLENREPATITHE